MSVKQVRTVQHIFGYHVQLGGGRGGDRFRAKCAKALSNVKAGSGNETTILKVFTD